MKKLLSLIVVLVMIVSMTISLSALADGETPTITAYTSGNVKVGTTYSTIDSAAAAAGVNGRVVLSAGEFYFNGRQTISVEGVTLEGAGRDSTKILTSSSFASASPTNKKALLTVAADNVTVKNMTIDGSPYGSTVGADTDFDVVRLNSGDGVALNNIFVTGSHKTLIVVGTSTTSTSVTATDLYCQAYYKPVPTLVGGEYTNVYADIDITEDSTFTLQSGVVNGFISTDDEDNFTNNTSNHYRLERTFLFVKYVDATTTVRHFVYSYDAVKNDSNVTNSEKAAFRAIVRSNADIIEDMTDEVAVANGDQELIGKFIDLLSDVLSDGYNSTIYSCRTRLQAVYTGGN